ncbi:hypothetical protein [Streptomyces lavendulae]|uniref:hypothetical protein n=1 Tax=Streptomyces lavendulae TaxID=1914 RepID=UPI003679D6C7
MGGLYADDPETDAVRRLGEVFTENEVRRADAFLEAGHQDADRLAAIAARLGKDAVGDEAWLVQQLSTAWMRWTSSETGLTTAAASWPIPTWPAPSTTSAGPGRDEPALPRERR